MGTRFLFNMSHRSYNVVNELIVHSGIDKIITLIYLGIRGFIYEKYGFREIKLDDYEYV